jgi:hypothetical protein
LPNLTWYSYSLDSAPDSLVLLFIHAAVTLKNDVPVFLRQVMIMVVIAPLPYPIYEGERS